MAKKDVFCVGFEFPDDDCFNVPFNSDKSLLDADIVLFEPTLEYQKDWALEYHQGKPSLSDTCSVQTRAALTHWHTELTNACDTGKTIFVFLKKPEEVYACTGSQEYSGMGRGLKVIRPVDLLRSYDCLPLKLDSLIVATGKKMKLTRDGSLIAAYWKSMEDLSAYEVHFELKDSTPLLVTTTGKRTVASHIRGKAGSVILLPPFDFGDREKIRWTKKNVQRGKALVRCLLEIHQTLQRRNGYSPAPAWCTAETYQLEEEDQLLLRIEEIESRIRELTEERHTCNSKMNTVVLPRALLYETGRSLELAIIDALRTFGFNAERYTDDESEFDVIFQAAEGRFLGEAEGRNNASINIDKLQQLERNIQEDYSKDEVTDFAKGVLFGNPHRLTEPDKREELFSAKVLSAAKRNGISLVHTPDLFPLVQYLKKHGSMPEFEQRIREAFAQSTGVLVKFPPVPDEM